MSPHHLNTARGVATWSVRAGSLLLIAAGAYLVLKRVALAAITGQFDTAFMVWEEIGEGQSFYRGLALLAVGTPLAFLSSHIARWIIAPPPDGCPRCGYEKVESDRCPECGLTGFGAAPTPPDDTPF